MAKKTIVALFDGLDYEYIKQNLDSLPFFKKLINEDCLCPLYSVCPADSIPSWTTIYTGLNPAEHGIIESIDYLDLKNKKQGDYSQIQGKTFFDKISAQNKKVLVYNPFMAYPSWEINGVMISGPVFEGGEVSISGDIGELKDTLPSLGGIVDYPTKKTVCEFFEKTIKLGDEQFDNFLTVYGKADYDFAFLGITTPDRIQHFLWQYQGSEKKKYAPVKNALLTVYQNMEKKAEYLFNLKDTNVIILSDHGHGVRCSKTFYINRWLIENGFIKNKSLKKRATERLKHLTLSSLAKMGKVEEGTRFLKKFKFLHKVKNADYVFNKKAKIYAPKFDGTNPFGGISLNKREFNSLEEYERVREEIIEKLSLVPIMEYVKKREDIYSGNMVNTYPDIVYKMKDEYGVDRGLNGKKLFGKNYMNQIISGGHREKGVILTSVKDCRLINSVLDAHEFILRVVKESN